MHIIRMYGFTVLFFVCPVQVPWTDLRYLFGEIMYGGHITDDWDRRLCRTYLEEYMKPELVSETTPPDTIPLIIVLPSLAA